MWRRFVRQLFALVLSVALATGVTIRVAQTGTANMTTMAMAADMPMQGKCDGCAGSGKAAATMACGVYCSGVVALESPSGFLDLVLAGFITAAAESTATGYGFPPDPYPPKSTHMS